MIRELIDRINEVSPRRGDALFGGFIKYEDVVEPATQMQYINECYGVTIPTHDKEVWITRFIDEILPLID